MRETPWTVAAAVAAACCFATPACSSSPKRPPEIGDCTPTSGASCVPKPAGGGGAPVGGAPDAGGDAAAAAGGDGGTCGRVEQVLSSATANTTCIPCVVANCCAADTVCSDDPGCVSLVQCAQNCQNGDTACVGVCESGQAQFSIPTYDDFAACVQGSCPGCPSLQQGTQGDF